MSFMVVGLINGIFPGADGEERLLATLADARQRGADLVVLPELPLQPWPDAPGRLPEGRAASSALGEPLEQAARRLSRLARTEAISLVASTLEQATDGRLHATTMLFAVYGDLLACYRKRVLQQVCGLDETQLLVAGSEPPEVVESFMFRLGVLPASDLTDPSCLSRLAEHEAEVLLCPRASEPAAHARWVAGMQAAARSVGCYVLSCNRPAGEGTEGFGSEALAVAPDGQILVDSQDPLVLVEVEREALARARAAR